MSKKRILNFIKNPIVKLLNAFGRLKGRIYLAAKSGKIWFPDKAFQKWDYRIHTGRKLNLRNPQTYCEKLQWLKYYYRNPSHIRIVDKYAVREYISETIGSEYLVPLYGVWDHFDEIDFDLLPDSFVLKCTHDQGSVILVPDKSKLDREAAREKLENGLKKNHFFPTREWPYKSVPARIVCEMYLQPEGNSDLKDYKFFCFGGGEKMFVSVLSERQTALKINYFDLDWNELSIRKSGYFPNEVPQNKPESFSEMLSCAKILSKNHPFIRVDFYELDGKVYFGELTLFDSAGRRPFIPEEAERTFGSWIPLPKKIR